MAVQWVFHYDRMGGQVFAAQELGKGRREEARQYAKAAVQLVILMGVLYGVVCLAFTDQLIGFFQLSDAESVAIGIQYTKITCGLILFSFLNFTLTGLYTAQGDSRTPFVANFAGMAANIVLDPLFIFGAGPIPGMQAAGAAVATVCSQIIVTMVLVVCTLKSRKDADNENILKTHVSDDTVQKMVLPGSMQDRHSISAAEYCILWNFHGAYQNGILFWICGSGSSESGRTDRIYFLEYG